MKRQDKVGVVMKDGEQLIPCEYDSISSWWEYGPSAHYVVKDKKVGIIDYIGKVLLPTENDSLDYVTKDVVIVTKDPKKKIAVKHRYKPVLLGRKRKKSARNKQSPLLQH